MCLILFSYQQHKDYPLIVVSNRDEFYNRPTKSAYFWEDKPNILAGRDTLEMGTWLGITKGGKFAALTNYRNPNESLENKRSRGEVVADFLGQEKSAKKYIEILKENRDNYRGYNVLLGHSNQLFYYSNESIKEEELTPGIYGLSNKFLNTPWPKVELGKAELAECLLKDELDVESLFQLLRFDQPFDDHSLPNTGVGIEWERVLSPLFIKSEHYGTRSSTVVLFDSKGNISFFERTYANGLVQNKEFIIESVKD